jgi:hypothetical protein
VFDWDGWDLIAPSAVPHSDRMPMPRVLSRAEIPELITHWGEAAARAHKAGFEMMEIHGAHGSLARELMYSSNWALDAAQKLGADPDSHPCRRPWDGGWASGRGRRSRVYPQPISAASQTSRFIRVDSGFHRAKGVTQS